MRVTTLTEEIERPMMGWWKCPLFFFGTINFQNKYLSILKKLNSNKKTGRIRRKKRELDSNNSKKAIRIMIIVWSKIRYK